MSDTGFDYVLKLGAQLDEDEAVRAINAQIRTAFKGIPPLELKATGIQQIKRDLEELNPVTVRASGLVEKFYESLNAGSRKAKDAAEVFIRSENDKERAAIRARDAEAQRAQQQEAEIRRLIATNEEYNRVQAERRAIGRQFAENTQPNFDIQGALEKQKALVKANDEVRESNRRMSENFAANLRPVNQEVERANGLWERYGGQMRRAAEGQSEYNRGLPDTIRNTRSFTDELGRHIKTVAELELAYHGINAVTHTFGKGITDAIHSEKEQTITGLYYEAQKGKGSYTPDMSSQAMDAAIGMARLYGEEVVHVQENVGLWAKITHGQLVPAIELTNAAMKMNADTGMNMEEIYRSTIAVFSQVQEPLSKVNELYDIGVGLALKYGGGIQSLGGESQDAAKQMIEGMDRLSAIFVEGLGKGEGTLRRIGAAVAVVSHDMNVTGVEAAGHLSAAFAKMEAGKLHTALHAIGIETRDNAHLIEDLGAKWGKVLPIIQAGGVRSQDLEAVATLIKNYQQYAQAVKDAGDAVKNHSADTVFEKLLGTTDMQIKQLKAGVETIGISFGREALPSVKGFVDYLNNQGVPAIMSHKAQLIDTAKVIGTVGLAYVGLNVAQGVIGGISRAWLGFEGALATVAGTQSTFTAAANLSLTNYQRVLLSTLSETGEVDAAMEESVKIMAVNYNMSIDSMILKLRELQLAQAATAESTSIADVSMTGATDVMSARIGVDLAAVKGEFIAAGETATLTAASAGRAMLSMIPIIGTVIGAAGLGYMAYDAIKKKHDADDDQLMRTNVRARLLREQQDTADAANAQKTLTDVAKVRAQGKYQTLHRVDPTGNKYDERVFIVNGVALRGADDPEARAAAARAQYDHSVSDREYLKHGLGGETKEHAFARSAFEAQKKLKQESDALAAKGAKDLANIYVTKPVKPQEYEDPAKAASTKGVAKDSTNFATDTKDLEAYFKALEIGASASIKSAKESLKIDSERIRVFGLTSEMLQALKKDTDSAVTANNNLNKTDEEYIRALSNRKAAALTKASQLTKPEQSQERDKFRSEADSIQNTIDGVRSRMDTRKQENQDLQSRLFDSQAEYGKAAAAAFIKSANATYDDAVKKLNQTKTVGDAFDAAQNLRQVTQDTQKDLESKRREIALRAVQNLRPLTKSEADELDNIDKALEKIGDHSANLAKVNDDLDTIKSKLADYSIEAASGGNERLAATLKRLRDINDEANKFKVDLLKKYGDDGDLSALTNGMAQVDQLKSLEIQTERNKLATEQYADAVKRLHESLAYTIFDKTLSSVGKTVGDSIYNGLNNTSGKDAEINGLQGRIRQLQEQAQWLNGQYQESQKRNLEQQIAHLQDEERKLQQQRNTPAGFLKSIVQDIEKSVIDSTIKKFEDNLKKMVTESILGPEQSEQQKLQIAYDTTTQQLISSLTSNAPNSFASSASLIAQGTLTLASALRGAGGGGGFGSDGGSGSGSVNLAALVPGLLAGFGGTGVSGIASGGSTGSVGPSTGGSGYNPANVIGSPQDGVPSPLSALVSHGALTSTALAAGAMSGKGVNAGTLLQNAVGPGGKVNWSNIGQSFGFKSQTGHLGGQMLGAYEAYQGYEQGGAGGAFMAAQGAFAATGNPYVAAGAAILTLLHHKDDPAKMPDKYNSQEYGKFVANMQGVGGWAGSTWYDPDASVLSATGNKGEGNFIRSFIAGKTDQQLQSVFGDDYARIKQMFGSFSGLANLKDGYLDTGGGRYFWSDIQNLGNEAMNDIVTNQGQVGTTVSVNAYGGAMGFSPWYTPGFDPSLVSNAPYGATSGSGTTNNTVSYGGGYATAPSSANPNGPGGSAQSVQQPQRTTTVLQVNLDGEVIARNSASYYSMQSRQGRNSFA